MRGPGSIAGKQLRDAGSKAGPQSLVVPIWAKEGRTDKAQRFWTESGAIIDAFSTEGWSKDKKREHSVLSFTVELDPRGGSGNEGKRLRCDLRLLVEKENVPEGELKMHQFSLARLDSLLAACSVRGDMPDGGLSSELLEHLFPIGSKLQADEVSKLMGKEICVDVRTGPDRYTGKVRSEIVGVHKVWEK